MIAEDSELRRVHSRNLVDLEVTFVQGPEGPDQQLLATLRLGETFVAIGPGAHARVRLRGGTLELRLRNISLRPDHRRYADNAVMLSNPVPPGAPDKVTFELPKVLKVESGHSRAAWIQIQAMANNRWRFSGTAWVGKVLGDDSLCAVHIDDADHGVTAILTVRRRDLFCDEWESWDSRSLTDVQQKVMNAVLGTELLSDGSGILASEELTRDVAL